MTPFTEGGDFVKKDSEKDATTKLWSSILSDVQTRNSNKLPSNKQVLVLGDNESGKTTLIAKLQGVEDPKKGTGLEYAYIDVRDEYRDDQTRLSVWILDGDPGHSNLLTYALNEETFENTLVILSVAMTSPWAILEQLENWVSILADHIDKLNLDFELRQQCKARIVKMWQQYVEPGDESDLAASLRRSSKNMSDSTVVNSESDLADHLEDGSQPLPEAVLTNNLALDIVVVVTKTDYITTLEKEHEYRDEHLDFIQQWIRKFCLKFGAALFYISAKEDKNCDLLYKYLTHRIYNLQFRTPALVVEKDAVFIPAGWDNLKKISIIYENLVNCKPDDYYRDIIVPPTIRKTVSNKEVEVSAEEEQSFLSRQLQLLLAGGGGPQPNSMSPAAARIGDSTLRTPVLGKASPRPSLEGGKVVGSPGGEGVLANFFNSLLTKKTGPGGGQFTNAASPKAPDNTPDKVTMRSDAAAELDRLTRSKKSATPPTLDLNSSEC